MNQIDRRRMLKLGAGAAALGTLGVPIEALAQAAQKGQLTLAFPTDVPTWDPNARTLAAVQSLYKLVFDQPLGQAPDLALKPAIVTKWVFENPTTLVLDLRSDVVFHDGSPLTSADIRFSFLERGKLPVPEGGRRLDTAFIWRKVGRHRDPQPDPRHHEVHGTDGLRHSLAGLPLKLCRAQGLYRASRPCGILGQADRQRPLQACGIPAGRPHRARSE